MEPELQWDFFPYLPVVLQDEATQGRVDGAVHDRARRREDA